MLVPAVLLSLPLRTPIGPMVWDSFIYYDAANRIFDGQTPSIDFFAPVGPLGYYLFAGWLKVFPNGNPVLLAHWSLLVVTAPLMALALRPANGASNRAAFALLVPFLIFALLPFNSREFYPFPGSDGFGIYNRQVCQVLYVLVAALTFPRSGRMLGLIVFAGMTALFFLKITGFVAAIPICLFALLSGRLPLRAAAAAALGFLAVLAGLELATGIVSHYLADIHALVAKNSGTLAPRLLQAASQTFGVVAPAGALVLLLLWTDRERLMQSLAALRRGHRLAAASRLLSDDALWLAAVLFCGILFETQNTGSQAMIFCWPPLLAILLRALGNRQSAALLFATVGLAAAAALPPAVNVLERAARTYAGAISNAPLGGENLKTLGTFNLRPSVLDRANHMLAIYAAHPEFADATAEAGEMTTPILYSDFDFQAAYLLSTDQAIDDIKALEAAKGVRFDTILSLNFVNPVPWLMDRRAPKHVAIGADPYRAMPDVNAAIAEAVADTDLVLLPKCPEAQPNRDLYAMYAPMLKDHRRIKLDACYDAFVHPRFAGKL